MCPRLPICILAVLTVAIGPTMAADPYAKIEAENWDLVNGIVTYSCSSSSCGHYIGNINNGDFLGYYALDFGTGAHGIEVRMAADAAKYDEVGALHLHVDNVTCTPFASIIMGNTGDIETFVTLSQFIEFPPVGVRDVFISFTTQYGTSDIGNIDWFQFFTVGTSSSRALVLPPPGGAAIRAAIAPPPSKGPVRRGATKDAFSKMQASSWDYQKGVDDSACSNKNQCDTYAGYIQRDDAIGYYGMDFGEGATGLEMALAANVAQGDVIGTIHFHLDNTSSSPFADVVTGNTGGEQVWTVVKQFIEFAPTGVHNLYFTFSADTPSDIGNIAWFQFFRVQ